MRAYRKLVRSLRKRLGTPPPRLHVGRVSDDPLVLVVEGRQDWTWLLEGIGDRDVRVLVRFFWNLDDAREVEGLRRRVERLVRRRPRLGFVFLCDTREAVALLGAAGLEAVHAHQSALLDEDVYRVIPGTEKRFDAVYDAQLSPFKRHALAAAVPRLALVSYVDPARFSQAYADEVHRVLAHATWLNDPTLPGWRFLGAEEVCRVLNAAHVGLCLSAVEGGMFAATQYLLCGLPVVSTRSRGGREVVFPPAFARVVDDDVQAVADAVRAFLVERPDPHAVRAAVLERVLEHRHRLIGLVQRFCDEAGRTDGSPDRWKRFRREAMLVEVGTRVALERIRAGLAPAPR